MGGYRGHLYTKHTFKDREFVDWLDNQFSNRFSDFDDTHAGINSDSIQLLNNDDYLIVTNHDYQEEFGITGKGDLIQQLREKLRTLNLADYSEVEYIQS